MARAPRSPLETATLLLLACFIIVLLGLSVSTGDRASSHKVAISAAGAVVLISLMFSSHLTFVLAPVYIGALLITAYLMPAFLTFFE